MNIYKAPNLIISPKRKVYRKGGGGPRGAGAVIDESIYTHTHTHTLSPSLPPLSASPSPLPYTHTSITGTGKNVSLEQI